MDLEALALRLVLTAASASVAEGVTYPIDAIKTRQQLERSSASTSGRSPAHTAQQQQGGSALSRVLGLYAGLTPALVRHVLYSGTRITVYEQMKSALQQQQGPGGAPGPPPPPGLGTKLLMGASAGALGQLVAVPADLVKVRMQADARNVGLGLQPAPRYKGMLHALGTITAQEGGLAGLWRGASPAVQRAALVNLGELATYDQAKQAVLASGLVGGDGLMAHAASSVCSGFFASVVSTPADVIKTRMMSQDPARPLYSSTLDCLSKSVRSEGLLALYRGFLPTWARLGPWQLCFWVTYEQLRSTAGIAPF